MDTNSLLRPDPRRALAALDRRIGLLERRVDPDKGQAPRPKLPIITVAASDTFETLATNATYRCDGVNDQNQIMDAAAQANASGGFVLLLGGTFLPSASILGVGSAEFLGSGPETVVVAPTGDYAFKSAAAQGSWSIRNMTISVPSGATGGIKLTHTAAVSISQVLFVGAAFTSGTGLYTEVNDVAVFDCVFTTLLYGYYALNGGRAKIYGNEVTNCGTGLYFDSSSNNLIFGNQIFGIRTHGIQGVSGFSSNNIFGNLIADVGEAATATYSGISIAGSNNFVHSNVFRDAGGNKAAYAVTLAAFHSDNWVALNDFLGFYATAAILDNAIGTVTFPGNRPFAAGATTPGHTIKDEGTPLAARAAINFVGDSVAATDDSGGNETDVTINHLASATHTGAQPVTVRKNSGADVGTRPRLNFIEGSNITLTVADDAGGVEVDVTIAAAGGGAGDVTDAFVPYYLATGETFTVPEFRQSLFIEPIELDGGTLDVEGLLIEVAQPPDLSAFVHMGA